MGAPLFSIIVPTYNRAHLIKKTIESVLSQTFKDFEIIVVDDGSTDHTAGVIQTYLVDKRIKYFTQENLGVSSARNFGADHALGSYLIFLDSDDKIESSYLETVRLKLLVNDGLKLLSTGVRLHEGKGIKYVMPVPIPMYSNLPINMLAGAFVVSKDLFDSLGQYDPRIYFGENGELGLRLSQRLTKGEVGVIKEIMLSVFVENEWERRKRYNAWKELSSCERILEMHGSTLQEMDYEFFVSMHSKIAVASLILNDNLKSRSFAILAFQKRVSFKRLLRLVLIVFLPKLYKRILKAKNYLP